MAKNDVSVKINSLTVYLEQMKNRLSSETGPLLEWIQREVKKTETKIENLKMR